jgi:hypothetical protein
MKKMLFAFLFLSASFGIVHCGGDDSSTGGSGGATTGGPGSTGATSTTSGAGGGTGTTGTGTGGAGGGLLGTCPASQPGNGSACPTNQIYSCPYGSTVCSCGAGQPWICFNFDGGFSLDGFSFDF